LTLGAGLARAQTATTPSTLSAYSTIYSIGVEWPIDKRIIEPKTDSSDAASDELGHLCKTFLTLAWPRDDVGGPPIDGAT